jgi:hypothetical protein
VAIAATQADAVTSGYRPTRSAARCAVRR